MDDALEVNRRHWDELARLHASQSSGIYDLDAFLAGGSTLRAIDREEVGRVDGLELLHLQCHFGMDTLSWARDGARATGLDFSGEAIDQARALARRADVEAEFVQADVLDPPAELHGRFDVVYTSYGVLGWLCDLERWAAAVRSVLRPGGRLHVIDGHPVFECLEHLEGGEVRVREPYFNPTPWRGEEEGTYALPDAPVQNKESVFWTHPTSSLITALLRAGLALRSYREFPYTYYPAAPGFELREDGYWDPPAGVPALPLMMSLWADRPAGS